MSSDEVRTATSFTVSKVDVIDDTMNVLSVVVSKANVVVGTGNKPVVDVGDSLTKVNPVAEEVSVGIDKLDAFIIAPVLGNVSVLEKS